jgi:hypothetical protein
MARYSASFHYKLRKENPYSAAKTSQTAGTVCGMPEKL